MLTKAQITVAKQIGQLPQPAAAPVAAPAVSVFAKAKNILNSVAVNSRTAKIAIGSIVTAAIVYAGFKFATAPAKKANEKKDEQKTTDRVIAKMQEVRTAAGKAYRQVAASAAKFKDEHPVAVKVIGAAVAASVLGLTAKLLYKPAAPKVPFNDANDPFFCKGDSEDAFFETVSANGKTEWAPYECTGDSEDAYYLELNGPSVEEQIEMKNAKAAVIETRDVHTLDKRAFHFILGAQKAAENEPKTIGDIGGGREYVHPEHNDKLPSLSNPAPEDSLESGNSTEDREYPVTAEESQSRFGKMLDQIAQRQVKNADAEIAFAKLVETNTPSTDDPAASSIDEMIAAMTQEI